VAPPGVPVSQRGDVYPMAEVDVAPYPVDQEAFDAALAAAVASSPWPPSRLAGTAVLRFVVESDGSVDAASVSVMSSPNQEVATLASDVVKTARFISPTVDGERVAVWMNFMVTLPPGRQP